MENIYIIEGIEYELYQAASGDFCVSVYETGQERKDYNVGSREAALDFILSEYEI